MSSKATRDSFGETLKELGGTNPRIVALDADLSVSTKSVVFARAFPERFFQMGISEANMIGVASGLSFTGFIPFLCSFGAFVTGRYDTLRVSVGYSAANVKIVGTHAGLGIGDDGYSQMGLEDINVMRALGGMVILQPCDHATTVAAVRFAAEHTGPVYLRLTRQKLPAIHSNPDAFQFGRGIVLREGGKVALVGSGATVAEILEASKQIQELDPWVIDMPTLKPIDRDLVIQLAGRCSTILTAEDHSITGGLGSAVAEVLAETGFAGRLVRVGLQDGYGESGDAAALYEKYGLSADRIAKTVQLTIS